MVAAAEEVVEEAVKSSSSSFKWRWRWRELPPQLTASKILRRNEAPEKAVHRRKLPVAVVGRSSTRDPMSFR